MPSSIILYIFVLFFLYFIGLSMLGPRIVALQLLWQVVGGSVGRLRFWEVSPKERCEWLWIGSYPIISTYNHGKLWWEPAYWPWIIEFQGNIPLLIDRWNNQRPWITFGWMEGNAKLDLLATGVICWVYYGYFITFRSWGSLSCRNPHLARWQCFLVIFPTRVFFVQHARNKCICIYIYICMYVCMYVYIYIYTRERSCCLVEWGLFRKGLSLCLFAFEMSGCTFCSDIDVSDCRIFCAALTVKDDQIKWRLVTQKNPKLLGSRESAPSLSKYVRIYLYIHIIHIYIYTYTHIFRIYPNWITPEKRYWLDCFPIRPLQPLISGGGSFDDFGISMNFLLLVTDDFILPKVWALNKTGHLLATKERSGARKAGENTSRRVCTERLRVRCISVHFGSCFATVQNRLVPRMACHPIKRKLDVTKTQIHRGFSVCKPFAADCMDTFHK